MSERETYPPGVPCWVDTLGPNPGRLTEFYGAIFGWDFAGPGAMPGDGSPGEYHVARLRGRDVAGDRLAAGGRAARPARLEHICPGRERRPRRGGCASRRRRRRRRTVRRAPAGRMAVLADPQGAAFCVWEAGDREGAQLVNEPGAWSMSFLNVRDTDAAATFTASSSAGGPRPSSSAI